MKKNLVPFLLVFVLFSCSSNSADNRLTTPPDSLKADIHPEKKVEEYKGVYHPGQFKNAANSELYTFNESDQKKLDSLYHILLPDPYPNQTVALNFKGIPDPQATNTGFKVIITALISMELKNAFNSAIPYEYWCMGNEPFWQVHISEKENLIDFYDPMIPKFYHFSFSSGEINGNITTYKAEDKTNNNTIKITITKEKCSDGMSERTYNYKSEIILNGITYKGCSIKFGEVN